MEYLRQYVFNLDFLYLSQHSSCGLLGRYDNDKRVQKAQGVA